MRQKAKLQTYINAQHRLGRDIRKSAIYAALHVEGVQRVELVAPVADIVLMKTHVLHRVQRKDLGATMSDTRLLPVGSSPLEVAAARDCADIENTPVPLRRLWNPDNCPGAAAGSPGRFLLTAGMRVAGRNQTRVIRSAWFIHAHKGAS